MVFIVEGNLENVCCLHFLEHIEARKYEGKNLMGGWIKEFKVQVLSH